MSAEQTSILAQELKPLQAQIATVREAIAHLEDELRAVRQELDAYAVERQQYHALQEVCAALDALDELEAGELFWSELPGVTDRTAFLKALRGRSEAFEATINGTLEREQGLERQLKGREADLADLNYEVRAAYEREERRLDEFVIDREVPVLTGRVAVMPWSTSNENEKFFRRAILVALLICLLFGGIVPMIPVPVPDRSQVVVEIPERIAQLVKKELPPPEPVAPQEQPEEEKKPVEEEVAKKKEEKAPKKETKVAASQEERNEARSKVAGSGVMAFKDSFKDLMEETAVPRLGTEARVNKKAPVASGYARPTRSLVAAQATGGSGGGVAVATVSRNLGSGGGGGSGDQIEGVAFSRVESTVAGLTEEEGRPLSAGPGPSRTDEEIQIVFDRYKASIYRIYNKELRLNPTLRGKMLLRITIEPDGSVSKCSVEKTDLDSKELVAKILERVKRFNFGAKADVSRVTIVFPIDFLPAG